MTLAKTVKGLGTHLGIAVLIWVLLAPSMSPVLVVIYSWGQPDRNASIPVSIEQYTTITVNATEIKERVSRAEEISPSLVGRTYPLRLTLNNMRSAGFKAMIERDNGSIEVALPPPSTYKGDVVGRVTSRVALTITDSWVAGYVSVEEAWIFIEPLRWYDPTADALTHFAYRTSDTDFALDDSGDALPIPKDSQGSSLVASLSSGRGRVAPTSHVYSTVLYADILPDGDPEFYDINPSDWSQRQTAVLNAVDTIFDGQIDIQFNIVAQHVWAAGGPLTSTRSSTLLRQFRDAWEPVTYPPWTPRDLAFLFTGKDLDGLTIGRAWLGGLGTSYHYSLAQQVPGGNYDASLYQRIVLSAHEIGHTFNAIHDEAAYFCVFREGGRCLAYGYTIMKRPWQGSLMQDEFSDGTQQLGKNNVERIRAKAEEEL